MFGGALFLLIFASGCLKKPSKRDVEANLKYSMGLFLNSPARVDTSKAKFIVLSVTYFEAKSAYECEFKVHLKNPATDTIGVMGASISKDFSQVKRKY